MKSLATLEALSRELSKSTYALRHAAFENLKELGEEVPVRSDEDLQAEDCPDYDPSERKGLYVYGPGKHGSLYLYEYRIDKVIAGKSGILCHYCEIDEHEANSWEVLEEFYDADCIIDAIQWPDSIEQGENDSDKELLVLCSTDEDNTKETYLTISKEDLKAGIHNERIVSELRKIFCVDDYVAQVGDEGEQEFQEAVESLLQGRDAAFECYEWHWQTVLAL